MRARRQPTGSNGRETDPTDRQQLCVTGALDLLLLIAPFRESASRQPFMSGVQCIWDGLPLLGDRHPGDTRVVGAFSAH